MVVYLKFLKGLCKAEKFPGEESTYHHCKLLSVCSHPIVDFQYNSSFGYWRQYRSSLNSFSLKLESFFRRQQQTYSETIFSDVKLGVTLTPFQHHMVKVYTRQFVCHMFKCFHIPMKSTCFLNLFHFNQTAGTADISRGARSSIKVI